MSTNKTPNLNLHSWEPTDPVKRVEFNDNWDAIDKRFGEISGSFAEVEALLNSHTASIAKLGNCAVETLSYTGTGKYGSSGAVKLTFSKKPAAFLICWKGAIGIWTGGDYVNVIRTDEETILRHYPPQISWNGRTASFYTLADSSAMLNASGVTYYVAALIAQG